MKSKILLASIFITCYILNSCNSNTNKKISDSSQTDTASKSISNNNKKFSNKLGQGKTVPDSNSEFEKRIYFKIDKIYTGKVYAVNNNISAFYRILIVPEEENIMVISENIEVLDDEGENLRLRKLSRLTDDDSALPKFGLSSVDSLKFIDSVTIEGYFNDKKKIINLDKLKPYHPVF